MEQTTGQSYYNAKPSNITNLGSDVSGAKRMNYDTYENPEVKKAKQAKAKQEKGLKSEIKALILSENPSVEALADLYKKQFELLNAVEYDRTREYTDSFAKENNWTAYRKLANAYNSLNRQLRRLKYYGNREILKLKKRYASKESFQGQSGTTADWKAFKSNGTFEQAKTFLLDNSKAVQFGNSVTDNERAYILGQLQAFLGQWQEKFSIDIKPVSWSFGARGNAQSVAYYLNSKKLISVNRDNIGSLIHELGHYIDYKSGMPSNKIGRDTIMTYRASMQEQGIAGKELAYYTSRVEIFARAFEAYCYKIDARFGAFAQSGKDYLPELNDELISIIENVLGIK